MNLFFPFQVEARFVFVESYLYMKYIHTQTEFSFSTIHEGKAIPKLIAPGPSGLPYFSQFLLASSSVRAW